MIITVSREFGSGGREVGKRLADALNLEYYDKQLVGDIAKNASLNENYVSEVIEEGKYKNYAYVFARSLPVIYTAPSTLTDLLVAQQNVIKALGDKGNCVIVGRCADAILRDYNPFKIFVYADQKSKIERCRNRAPENEHLTDKQMVKKFKEIDKGRKNLHDLFSSSVWGERSGYDLMLNTSKSDVKKLIPALAELIKSYS